ncbi:MAG: DNA polymerase III subunit chi [Candidatus Competibacteraceae bacterium]|nr:DNA polymerase III subunit chi [Candidatus Competibacteraceae bacterium]MBK7984454.1 DNA polymerase III subunit chi [Candidatus Competibacteraceae bacterium]MBK8897280.1 DNA polymerase III subunit chi [Candidatus Competibacteraceae bacterium]MBK8964772.1 DNA polymerase III subunit chi [Candidatus Competibacteraceae bacterium]MBK9950048.1 DNA polymerase III subunit chi [Candidatus Competibacteraceae bacterium]
MSRVDFYVLSDQKDNGRALLACRLIDKAYTLGHTIYLLAASDSHAAALDDLLWTFRQDSFIPHERYPLEGEGDSPVLIGTRLPADRAAQVLINFSDALPDGFERYERVVELVDQTPEVLAKSRERFRQYRERGLTPETHKL